jgi:hypothetical protein
LISSTFGDGDPPDNGEGFWHSLSTAETRLESLRFAVLALGDPNYDQFCNHGKQLDQRLLELGATRLLERVDCDTEFEALADAWLVRFQQTLTPAKPVALATPAGKTKLYGSRLLLNRQLNPLSAHKETRQFALDLADSGLTYEAGDALGVRPRNCPELVNELLDLTRLKASTCVNIDTFGDEGEGVAAGPGDFEVLSEGLLQGHVAERVDVHAGTGLQAGSDQATAPDSPLLPLVSIVVDRSGLRGSLQGLCQAVGYPAATPLASTTHAITPPAAPPTGAPRFINVHTPSSAEPFSGVSGLAPRRGRLGLRRVAARPVRGRPAHHDRPRSSTNRALDNLARDLLGTPQPSSQR